MARLHCFYGLLRWLGIDVEYKVNADGTFQFDQWVYWLLQRFGQHSDIGEPGRPQGCAPTFLRPDRPLYSDDEVIADLLHHHASLELDAQTIALRYIYPVKYVEEVLLPKITMATY